MIITNLTDVDYWFGPMHLAAGSGETLTLDDTSDTSLYLLNDEVADAVNTLYLASNISVSSANSPFPRPTGTPALLHGDGSPQGMVYAPQGSLYMRRDSMYASTGLYTKTTGVTQNTGWISVIAPAMQFINEVTVPTATQTISFGSIPQTYTHLKIIASLGSAQTTGPQPGLQMTVNGSSGAYYDTQQAVAAGGAISAAAASGTTNATLGSLSLSGYIGPAEITLMQYTSSSEVAFSATVGMWSSMGTGLSALSTGMMKTSSLGGAVTSVTLTCMSNFAVGSVATLYGLTGGVT